MTRDFLGAILINYLDLHDFNNTIKHCGGLMGTSELKAQTQPRCRRDAAEMQSNAAEMSLRYGRDGAEIPAARPLLSPCRLSLAAVLAHPTADTGLTAAPRGP